jgi:Rieske Fe-S protein
MAKDTKDKENISRRRFLGFLSVIGLGWLGAILYPVYEFLSPQQAPDPFGEDGRALVEKITPADVARPGMGKNGGYGGRGLILFRNEDGQLQAFDSKCTHAGCNVEYQTTRFYCNCHGGIYDLNGKNIAGPPPKPLTELGVVEEDGQLFVYRMTKPGETTA